MPQFGQITQLKNPNQHLTRISHAQSMSPERAEQKSPGREPWEGKGHDKSPERAKQAVPPFQGLPVLVLVSQGLRPGLSCSAPAGLLTVVRNHG